MDPLSIAVGTVGIADTAISRVIQVHELIQQLAEADDVANEISKTLEAIQQQLDILKSLNGTETDDKTREDLKRFGVLDAVERCGKECNRFSKQMERWTKHSRGTRQIQLRSRSLANTHTESSKKELEALEKKLQDLLDLTHRQSQEAQQRKIELKEEPEDEEDPAQRLAALDEVDRQARLLKADQRAYVAMYKQVHGVRTGQDIGKITTRDRSVAFVGMPAEAIGKINQYIGEVTTEEDSKSFVGIFNGTIDMRTFSSVRD